MATYLGILLFSFITTGIIMVPFIDLLFKLKLTHKSGTPTGAGILLVTLMTAMFAFIIPLVSRLGLSFTSLFSPKIEYQVIFFTLISFGLLGLFEDLVKTFNLPVRYLRIKHPAQLLLGFIASVIIYQSLGISHINLPIIGVLNLGAFYVPVSALIIYIFARGVDITDGVDGLAGGVLLISLATFWVLAMSALDTHISIFVAIWIGSLLAFLYFNVYPARIWLGNSGSLSFGATLAVIALILGKVTPLLIIGAIFLVQALANLIQFVYVRVHGKKLFPYSPPHYWLMALGWHEAKVTLRAWLLTAVLALAGLWLSTFT
ncbi:MAG: hypothetical protein AAB909_03710 [Patescibacteria group bacterium]